MNPPYDYDVLVDDVCMMCLVNICGLCETKECVCGHGMTWPAANPWVALWHFGPGTLGYSAAMALTAVHEAYPVVPVLSVQVDRDPEKEGATVVTNRGLDIINKRLRQP